MNIQEELIHRFYTAFQQLDADAMCACYHEEASFQDPVFDLKSKDEIKAMWTMLCERAQDFELSYQNVEADHLKGSATWIANYTFSKKDRKVANSIKASFMFKDGLIISHHDSFNFWKWSQQALGITGHLMGWSSILKNKVKKEAKTNLIHFQRNKPDGH